MSSCWSLANSDAFRRRQSALPSNVTARAWRIIVTGALIVALSLGIRQTFGLFLRPMSVDLSFTRESFSVAIAIQNLLWGLTQPLAGMIADTFGSGRVIVVGGILYASGLALMSFTTGGDDLYLSLGVLIGLGLSGTTFAVVLGAVGRVVSAEKRSLALGLVTAGGSLGMFALVPGAQVMLSDYGWVTALYLLAVTALLMPLLAAPLGVTSSPSTAASASVSLAAAFSHAQRHRGYWLLNAGFFVCGFHVTFIATHLPAYLADHSLPAMTAAMALALIGFFNVIGTYVFGWLGGWYRKKYLLSGLYSARAVVILLFFIAPLSEFSALSFAVAIGLLWLGTIPLTSGLVAQMFGVRYLSTLFGVVFLSHQLGSFCGVWLGGYVFDATGSYDTVWMLAVGLGVISALLHWPIDDAPVTALTGQAVPGRVA